MLINGYAINADACINGPGETVASTQVTQFYSGGFIMRRRKPRKVAKSEPEAVTYPFSKFPDLYSWEASSIARRQAEGQSKLARVRKPGQLITDWDMELLAAAALLIAEMHYNRVNQ